MNAQAMPFEPYSVQYQRICAYRARLAECTGYLIEHKENVAYMQNPAIQRAVHVIAMLSMEIDYKLRLLEVNVARMNQYMRVKPRELNANAKKPKSKKSSFACAMRDNNIRAVAAIIAGNCAGLDKIYFQPHLALEFVAKNAKCVMFTMDYLRAVSLNRRRALFDCSFAHNKFFKIMKELGVPREWLADKHITAQQHEYLASIGYVENMSYSSESDNEEPVSQVQCDDDSESDPSDQSNALDVLEQANVAEVTHYGDHIPILGHKDSPCINM